MLNLTATSLFDGTLATFLVVFTLLLILITKNNIRKRLMENFNKSNKRLTKLVDN